MKFDPIKYVNSNEKNSFSLSSRMPNDSVLKDYTHLVLQDIRAGHNRGDVRGLSKQFKNRNNMKLTTS